MKSKFKHIITTALTVVFASGFQALFLYCQNASEAAFSEIIPALLAFVGMGLALWLIFWLITRSLAKAAVSASIMALVLTNFKLIETGGVVDLSRLEVLAYGHAYCCD